MGNIQRKHLHEPMGRFLPFIVLNSCHPLTKNEKKPCVWEFTACTSERHFRVTEVLDVLVTNRLGCSGGAEKTQTQTSSVLLFSWTKKERKKTLKHNRNIGKGNGLCFHALWIRTCKRNNTFRDTSNKKSTHIWCHHWLSKNAKEWQL